MASQQRGKTPEIKIKKVEKPPYMTDPSKLGRFSVKNIIFERVTSDPSWKGYMQMYDEKVPSIVEEGRPGYSRVDFALDYASWIVHDAFEGGVSHSKIKLYRNPACTVGVDWAKTKHTFDNLRQASAYAKRAARFFGATLVGICRLNENWLYAEADIPEGFENVVVLAVVMDAEGVATSPGVPAAGAIGLGYSKMCFILACLGEFIRNLGYEAIQCGNDTALSIPLAIDTGLGELGRNGLLITPEYGSRVRLCKIFTDLPLEPDSPIEFGVREFCKKCRLCAKNCKAKAISEEGEPSFEVACRSNNLGTLKWYVNAELCYNFWCENGIDCSTCIKVCPYDMASTKKTLASSEFWRQTKTEKT